MLALLLTVICAIGCSGRENIADVSSSVHYGPITTGELTFPVIRFTEFSAPSPGTIESVSKDVDRFTPQGWVPLHPGDVLESGARFQLGSGASAKVRFSGHYDFTFAPQKDVRGFILKVQRNK